MHAEKSQRVQKGESQLSRVAAVLGERSSLQLDDLFVELSLQRRERSEQIVGDLRRQRRAENRRCGASQHELVCDSRQLNGRELRVATSAERIAAKSRSAALQPLRRPASMGFTKSCRKEASEENTPGFTNSESAKSSYPSPLHSLSYLQIVLDGRSGEQHAATRRELEQTVDRRVSRRALEAMALVADQQTRLAAVDRVGVLAVHLMKRKGAALTS